MKDGGYIKKGFDRRLDEYRGAGGEGKSWIAELEAKERASTGIKTLKIGFNRVFGYYIEVSKSQTQLVPYSYHRKQTIAGGERYITEELKQIEEKILTSEECSVKLEAELFQKTLAVLVLAIPRLQLLASHIAALDVFCSLASVSRENNYSKPVMTDDGGINIIDGRHPAIERLNKNTEFVPNNTLLDNAENRILVITGPNMGGKSTYMRQVALIVFMAHIGCFVPAKSARISITDRIFTRVGASDDLAMGQSTFMVEMIEVAEILKNATSSSLLILDEIGRGTSTLDGLSIAWAVMEYLAVTVNAKALFATHFHELTDLETVLRGVKNYKVSIKELNKNVVFLYKILRGSANKSFGVEVAGLAGLPDSVVARSKELLKLLELHNLKDSALKLSKLSGMQLSLFDYGKDALKLRDEIIDILKAADCNNLTPIAAFELLSDLKTRAKEC
jgi:DNA mismatch repair protein MutS